MRFRPYTCTSATAVSPEDLLDFLRRAECRAERTGEDRIDVYVPRALSEEQARREVSLYVATWRARHPSADVFFVE